MLAPLPAEEIAVPIVQEHVQERVQQDAAQVAVDVEQPVLGVVQIHAQVIVQLPLVMEWFKCLIRKYRRY